MPMDGILHASMGTGRDVTLKPSLKATSIRCLLTTQDPQALLQREVTKITEGLSLTL